jgi:hypothetical protein
MPSPDCGRPSGSLENAAWNGTGGGVYKSTDGKTWRPAVCPETSSDQPCDCANNSSGYSFVALSPGWLSRSDDAGEPGRWRLIRPAGRIGGDALRLFASTQRIGHCLFGKCGVLEVVDGGKTWAAFRGARVATIIRMLSQSEQRRRGDQAVIPSAMARLSSWYNQPTAKMYHVNADNAFPYQLCSSQRRAARLVSRAAATTARSRFAIGIRWAPKSTASSPILDPDPSWRQADALRSAHGAGSEHHAQAFRGADFRVIAHSADRVFAARSAHHVLRD